MKILLATGASGGHVFPALSVALELKSLGHDVRFVTTAGAMENKIKEEGFSYDTVSSRGVSFASLASAFVSLGRMAVALVQSLGLLRKFRPDCVAGFGGYGAFPVVLAACCLNVPSLIHEQNVFPGRSNRILARWVRKIAVTFAEGKKYFPDHKTVWTGYPQHIAVPPGSREELLKKFHLSPGRKTILILGGSQGSQRINRGFLDSVPLLKSGLDFQAIHITGENDFELMNSDYKNTGISYCIFPFFDRMEEAYRVSDCIVARSGAGVVSEAAMFGLPAVFIPYPFAGGHQRENARVLSDAGIAAILEEQDFSPQRLTDCVKGLLKVSSSNETIALKLKNIYVPDAAKRLAQEIVRLKQ